MWKWFLTQVIRKWLLTQVIRKWLLTQVIRKWLLTQVISSEIYVCNRGRRGCDRMVHVVGFRMRGALDTTVCDKVCQWLTAGRWFSLSTPVSSTPKNWTIVESGVKHNSPNPIMVTENSKSVLFGPKVNRLFKIGTNHWILKILFIVLNVSNMGLRNNSIWIKSHLSPSYVRVGIFLTCGTHLHYHLISIREEAWVHTASLTQPLWSVCTKWGMWAVMPLTRTEHITTSSTHHSKPERCI